MKNPHWTTDSALYLQLTNTSPAVFLTASLSDQDTIEGHRWRWLNGTAATVIENGPKYVTTTLASLLMGVEPEVSLFHRDGNPYNYQRDNLSFFNSKVRNQYVNMGATTYLLVRGPHTVLIDTNQVSTVHPYTWAVRTNHGKQIVLADYKVNGRRCIQQLPRLVYGMEKTDNRPLRHKNGDVLDCRIENLEIVHTGPQPKHREHLRYRQLFEE